MRAGRRRRPAGRLVSLLALCALVAVAAAVGPSSVPGARPRDVPAAGEAASTDGNDAASSGQGSGAGSSGNDIAATDLAQLLALDDGGKSDKDRTDEAVRMAEGLVEGLVWSDVPTSLRETARSALETYRDTSPCVLLDSGYLDVSGNAWACLVQGGDWVEVCVVRSAADGQGSSVATVRMDIDEWERELGPLVGEGA